MFIYGHLSSPLHTAPLPGSCSACAAVDSQQLHIVGHYAHVYWLPLFSIGKSGAAECQQCQRVIPAKHMEPVLKQAFITLRKNVRVPAWHFAGLLLVVLGLAWSTVVYSTNQKANQVFIAAPHKGDMYHIKTDNGHYSLLKVAAVAGNSVKLLANSYEIDQETKVAELNKPENYASEPVELTRYDLNIMLAKKEIVAVERP
ncbi:hypothetical protein [Hymenobacter sp. AT01-02]|uniref:hypothetical protein n=1 Tax=Hymenobacter sp. AT01-02 TaxID=1571877 RepID=UPI0005F0F123|nr:hypothetical protein [Hymenobacter sp. AT01-02]